MTAYGEREYRTAKAALTADTPCWRAGPRCTGIATTIDHVPPLAAHDHVAGSGCCMKLPACAPCNYGAGARHGNALRHRGGRQSYAVRRW